MSEKGPEAGIETRRFNVSEVPIVLRKSLSEHFGYVTENVISRSR